MTDVRLITVTVDELREVIREELARARGEELLTPAQAGAVAGVTSKTVLAWTAKGLQYQLAGTRKRIRRADLQAFMRRNKSAAHLRLLGGA